MAPFLFYVLVAVALGAQLYALPFESVITLVLGILVGATYSALVAFIMAAKIGEESGEESVWARWWSHRPVRFTHWVILTLLPFAPATLFFQQAQHEFYAYAVSDSLSTAEREAVSSGAGAPLFALISDTHITDHARTLEHHAGGPDKLCRTLSLVRRLNPPVLIVSGDLTDRGESAEWLLFDSLLHQLGEPPATGRSEIRPLFTPGNHDVQGSPFVLADRLQVATEGDDHVFDMPYLAREEHFLKLAQRWQGDVRTLSTGLLTSSTTVASLDRLAEDAGNRHIMTIAQPPRRVMGQEEPSEPLHITLYPPGFAARLAQTRAQFDSLFPMVFEDARSSTAFVLLNSSADVFPGPAMGLGALSRPQLDRLDVALRSLAASVRTVVVILHHAPVRRETDQWSLMEFLKHRTNSDVWHHSYLAMRGVDATGLVTALDTFALSRPGIQVVVAYGHRHGPRNLGRTSSGLWMLEAPSVIEETTPGAWMTYRDTSGRLSFRWVAANLIGSTGRGADRCWKAGKSVR